MKFADPYLLAALVLVPLAVIVYVVFAQRSRRAARAAANPALWPNLMPRRPGWRRHVPPALLLLALGLLLVGAARPQAMMASDQKETTVVLTVDTSNSMAATDVHPEPHRGSAQRGAGPDRRVSRRTPRSASSRSHATCTSCWRRRTNRTVINSSLGRLKLTGGTALGPAIDRAMASLKASHSAVKGRAIIVISDGKSTEGKRSPLAAARAAKAAGVRVYTVSLGTANGTVQEAGKTVTGAARSHHAAARGSRQRRALLPRRGRQVAAQRLPHDRQRGAPPGQAARHQLRVHGGRGRAHRRWQPALAGLVPPPDLSRRSERAAQRSNATAGRATMACRRCCVRPRDVQQPGPGTHVAGLTLVLRTWHRLLRTDVEAT